MNEVLPVIGITCCHRDFGVEKAQAVMDRYVRAATTYAECSAVLIPANTGFFDARSVAKRLDGLLLTGSPSNIEAHRYGQAEGEGPFDAERDAVSFALIECLTLMGRPVFGICRGFQEINVALGGTLRRDLGTAPVGSERLDHHAPAQTRFADMFDHAHPVALTPDGVLARAVGREALRVNSVHFQGVDRLAEGLSVEAVAPDGVVEAFSANIGGAQVLGVQWHPEWQPELYPDRQAFFRLLGAAVRGNAI
ncbi:gamma-glutamyl-gamma-aminobutyrate hydrolase family protein [Asticcacaulis excentricus]|uniref:Peptidase C26 n=1 Tax=Asticcacaulis excentricus (strain ATCC 15261 / DSM 4724 / KCTC 12464 / NCIMB 9791 / VKM B-1370 / CB 48) TaxID=573065 RepID=E8RLC3_ASTEC|nr:gamma-glutamyl-gamma-aminobutyrate hydrolase family protein [Asticcacaulis excentricus]ADU12613.1 peptidase C26 [Asticcacaulis excentricus CB 48]